MIEVRHANESDAAAIARVRTESWRAATGPESGGRHAVLRRAVHDLPGARLLASRNRAEAHARHNHVADWSRNDFYDRLGLGRKLAGPTILRSIGRPVLQAAFHQYRGFSVARSFLRLDGHHHAGEA